MPQEPTRYSSDTPAVVTVDASGNVAAVSLVSANITVADLANGLSTTTQVQVVAA